VARATVLFNALEVDPEYVPDAVGVNTAVSATEPTLLGTQSHIAVEVAVTAPQPLMVALPALKFTVPA
jgi:hypothetical protein